MFTEPPLAVIFSKLPELVGHIKVLEDRPTTGQRHDALRSVLELVCQDLGEFISDRYTQLHEAAVAKLPKSTNTKKWRKLRDKSDKHIVDGRQTCLRIGQALKEGYPGRWNPEASLVEGYDHLLSRLNEQHFEPLDNADLPRCLARFCKRACTLAQKLARAEPLTLRERRTAGMIARKAVTVTLVIGGLVGLEQDIGPFIKDMEAFARTVLHGLDLLINDDEFVVPLPRPENLTSEIDQPVARLSKPPSVVEPPSVVQPPDIVGPSMLDLLRPEEPDDDLPRPDDIEDLDEPEAPEPTEKPEPPEPWKPIDEPEELDELEEPDDDPWRDGPGGLGL